MAFGSFLRVFDGFVFVFESLRVFEISKFWDFLQGWEFFPFWEFSVVFGSFWDLSRVCESLEILGVRKVLGFESFWDRMSRGEMLKPVTPCAPLSAFGCSVGALSVTSGQ